MRKELVETGKTVDAAIDSACEKLGCERDNCEWEIIDLPKRSFFGLKHTPAKVRVSIEVPDPKPVQQPKRSEPKPQAEPKQHMEPRQQREPKPQQPKQEQKPKQPKPEMKQERIADEPRPDPVPQAELSEKEKLAIAYLTEVLASMGLTATFSVTREHGGSCVNIVGEGLGMIIGRRGETLDAIQYLAGLVANRGDGDYLRLTVDCGDYRFKRKDTLEALAKKLASQVLKTNVSKTLEPMNPFERRIIHATVSEIEGVSSSSIGEEPNRRVVITSPTAKPASRGTRGGGPRRPAGPRERERDHVTDRGFKLPEGGAERAPRPERSERRGRSRDDRRGGERDRDRRSGGRGRAPAAPSGPPKTTPESEATSGISFGKIDLE